MRNFFVKNRRFKSQLPLFARLLWRFAPQKCWRLRVVADSDGDAAQRDKLRVRDAVLLAAQKRPRSPHPLLAAARSVCPGARMRLRLYPPARPRPTLEIRLGAGAGRNWLGMLFPQLFGAEEGKTAFRWLLIELLKDWGWL